MSFPGNPDPLQRRKKSETDEFSGGENEKNIVFKMMLSIACI